MKTFLRFLVVPSMWLACAGLAAPQTLNPNLPTWWQKYQISESS